MNIETLLKSIDLIASDFLFLDSQDMNIPTAGKFLNSLEGLTGEAAELGIVPVLDVAKGMNVILECVILDSLADKGKAISTFERGIALLQEIADEYKKQEAIQKNTKVISTRQVLSPGGRLKHRPLHRAQKLRRQIHLRRRRNLTPRHRDSSF